MSFHDILHLGPDVVRPGAVAQPDCFVDLNLDQIVAGITAGYQDYDLAGYFHAPLTTPEAVRYRHEVMRDLERAPSRACIQRFTASMRTMRERLDRIGRSPHDRQRRAFFLAAVGIYCDAVEALQGDLAAVGAESSGLRAFGERLAGYVASAPFVALAAETRQLDRDLAAVRYCLHIDKDSIHARRYADEADYGAEIEEVFARFAQGVVKSRLVAFPETLDMNPVEAAVLDLVARLFPEPFQALDRFVEAHADFVEPMIRHFDRQIHFYVCYLNYIEPLRRAGLGFCYPVVSPTAKDVSVRDGFDLALAHGLVLRGGRVVCNDIELRGKERLLVISGPNQGGKTTFARMFGQLHHLASLGCPVPGTQAKLQLPDRIFTHFEREEDIATQRSKLEDDLYRLQRILERATPHSLLVMNEIFTSTTLDDAMFISRAVLARLVELDLLCAWVTFIEEVATWTDKAVSMVGAIVPGDPTSRTFRIVRRPADGASHAMILAEKHRLTYAQLMARMAP